MGIFQPGRRGWGAAAGSSVAVLVSRVVAALAAATVPASPVAVRVPAREETGVAAVGADRAHEGLRELVQDVAAVAHPHRPVHSELRQGHVVARAPVAEHEPTISGINRFNE